MKYTEMSRETLSALRDRWSAEYRSYAARGLKLDISRGKPSADLLDYSMGVLSAVTREECMADGADLRNYGMGDGIPAMKKLFAALYHVPADTVFVGGNSSLQLMYDTLVRAMLFGFPDSPRPWYEEPARKWICVVPGYDRHFFVTETLGFELLSVPMLPTGPDMDAVEALVRDPAVKGIWCVPKYSNPTGNTYSDETVRRLARMETAAPDFRIMWDNAYAIHDFDGAGDVLLDILPEAEAAGHPDRVLYFGSTSKITLPGAGVAMMAGSRRNIDYARKLINIQTIGYDKINQYRHVRFLKDRETTLAHMEVLGAGLKKKFDMALAALEPLREEGIAAFTEPRGGYFISLDVMDGCATRVYRLMKDAGVTLTAVGATFPYGKDPHDRNLRLAPTYPSDGDLTLAMRILAISVRLAATEKLLGE